MDDIDNLIWHIQPYGVPLVPFKETTLFKKWERKLPDYMFKNLRRRPIRHEWITDSLERIGCDADN